MTGIVFSPLGIFFIFLALSVAIYFLSGLISYKGSPAEGKLKMYACGEDLPARPYNPSVQMFFHIALYFTILDVCALTLATLPRGSAAVMGLFYLAGIVLSVFALILR